MRASEVTVSTQEESLGHLRKLVVKGIKSWEVRETALQIIADCPNRNISSAKQEQIDLCELKAVYAALKHGAPGVPGLERGVPYIADPVGFDLYTAPKRLLEACKLGMGSCREDCDGLAALQAALLGTLGFSVGLRAWGKLHGTGFQHVYTVVHFPKREKTRVVSLDLTVKKAEVGWQPPAGRVMTAWVLQ